MKNYVFICLFVLFFSCSGGKKENNMIPRGTFDTNGKNKSQIIKKSNVYFDSIIQGIIGSNKKAGLSITDTIKYQFTLEDVGTEGNEGIAYYYKDSVRKVEINIYTSMWKTYLLYIFENKLIKVTERTFNTYEDIQLVRDYSYTMDFNGNILEKVNSDRVDVYKDLKKVVPFILK